MRRSSPCAAAAGLGLAAGWVSPFAARQPPRQGAWPTRKLHAHKTTRNWVGLQAGCDGQPCLVSSTTAATTAASSAHLCLLGRQTWPNSKRLQVVAPRAQALLCKTRSVPALRAEGECAKFGQARARLLLTRCCSRLLLLGGSITPHGLLCCARVVEQNSALVKLAAARS